MQGFIEKSQSYVHVVLETARPLVPTVSDSQSLLESTEAVPIDNSAETDLTHGILPCHACGRKISRREEEAAVQSFGNRFRKSKSHWDAQLRASQEKIAKLQRNAVFVDRVAHELLSRCGKLQSLESVWEDLLPETISE